MANKRNIPAGDIASNPILKAAYEAALARDPVQSISDFKKATRETDPNVIKSIKDLSEVVKRQDKSNVEVTKYLKRIDKNTENANSNDQVLNTTLLSILREIEKLNNTTKKEDTNIEDKLESIDEHIKEGGMKAGGEGASSPLGGLLGALTGLVGKLGPLAGIAASLEIIKDGIGAWGMDLSQAPAGTFAPEWLEKWAAKVDKEWDDDQKNKRSYSDVFSKYKGVTPQNEISESVKESQRQTAAAVRSRTMMDNLPEIRPGAAGKPEVIPGTGNMPGYDPNAGGQFSSGGEVPKSGWWTPEKQKYAVEYLMKNGGFTEYGAAAAVARMTKEAPKGPGDSNNIGGGHWGIAQWGVNRRGREMAGASFEEQLAWYVKETRTSESAAGDRFRSAKTAQEGAFAAASFERAEGWKESGGKTDVLMNSTPIDAVYKNAFSGNAPAGGEQQKSSAAKMPSNPSEGTPPGTEWRKQGKTDVLYDTKSGAGVYQMQGTARYNEILASTAQQTKSSSPETETSSTQDAAKQSGGSYPSGDIVALGKALQGEGLRISEHPAFGGVQGKHKGRGHYEGRAIDVNVGNGNVEANDPVMGAKFDSLADRLNSLGYKVFWRGAGKGPYGLAGHENHLHAEIPAGGQKTAAGEKMGAAAGLPPSRPAAADLTPIAASETAAPVSQAPMTPAMGMGMPGGLGGMMGMIPGFGGIGGMIGGLLGSIGGLFEGLFGGLFEDEQPMQMQTTTGESVLLPPTRPSDLGQVNAPLPPTRPKNLKSIGEKVKAATVFPTAQPTAIGPVDRLANASLGDRYMTQQALMLQQDPSRMAPGAAPPPMMSTPNVGPSYAQTNSLADNVLNGLGTMPSGQVAPSWIWDLPLEHIHKATHSGRKSRSGTHQ